MTLPRRVVPGQTWLLTRRCTQRQFLMRPDAEMNNAYLYCLIEAAEMFNIKILLSQMMSNHHHTEFYDPDGNAIDFYQRFHTHLARCMNVLRGRWENAWSSAAPSLVELADLDTVIDKLVYTATNPVKDDLVDKMHHWPGPRTVNAFFKRKPIRAERPRFLFRQDGPLPEVVEMTFEIPKELGDHDAIVERVRAQCAAVEKDCARARAATHRQVLGRRRIKHQSWESNPTTAAPHRRLSPRVAAREKWTRIEILQRNREFLIEYRSARLEWLAGVTVVFPAGTYWLRRFAGVPTASLT